MLENLINFFVNYGHWIAFGVLIFLVIFYYDYKELLFNNENLMISMGISTVIGILGGMYNLSVNTGLVIFGVSAIVLLIVFNFLNPICLDLDESDISNDNGC